MNTDVDLIIVETAVLASKLRVTFSLAWMEDRVFFLVQQLNLFNPDNYDYSDTWVFKTITQYSIVSLQFPLEVN